MKAKKSIRGRVSPKPALGRRQFEEIGRFADRIGKSVYSTDWQHGITLNVVEPLREGSKIAAGSNADLALIVHDQILDALRAQTIVAVIHVEVAVVDFSPLPSTDDDAPPAYSNPIFKRLRLMEHPLADEDAQPRRRAFRMKPDVWTHDTLPRINWDNSTVTVHCDQLDDWRSQGLQAPPQALFDLPDKLNDVQIGIMWPDGALAAIFGQPLPDAEWFERYKPYRSYARVEALAAAWRFLAIQSANGAGAPKPEQLAIVMRDYLAAQGNKVADKRDSGLNAMAARVLRQLANRDEGSVLVSSNPRKSV